MNRLRDFCLSWRRFADFHFVIPQPLFLQFDLHVSFCRQDHYTSGVMLYSLYFLQPVALFSM